MLDTSPFYITTAISYPNGRPHIGHAYEIIATDAIARYMRACGREVFLLTGTDDHGQKMFQTARAQGKTPAALADELTPAFREMGAQFACQLDDFIRTCEPRHHVAVQEIWRRIAANGDIYKDAYEGWYSVRDEAFYNEDELVENADGEKRAPSGAPVEWVAEESYFFRLSKYGDRLLEHYAANPDFIRPASRHNEVVNFVKGGLKDLSISRTSFDWGVAVPDDPAHVVYVWLDALTNYLTATGFASTADKPAPRWPADLHIIGKDITRFHAVYWPAFLLAAGLDLPQQIFAHGFLNFDGEKMSKSRGNVIDPFAMLERYGADALRYFFLREIPFGGDGNFNDAAIITRVNADLANDLGNLAQRSLSMIAKNLDGICPTAGALTSAERDVLARFDALRETIPATMEKLELHRYLGALMGCVSAANRYFAEQEPWALRKADPARMQTVLYVTAEAVRQAALWIAPITPQLAGRLLDSLGQPATARDFAALATPLASGVSLPPPQPVFPRLEESDA